MGKGLGCRGAIVVLSVAACSSHLLQAGEEMVWEQVRTLGAESSVEQAEGCVLSFRATRTKSIARLIEVACDAQLSNHARRAAINMLGDLRAVEAVNALMGQLDARIMVGEVLSEPTTYTFYPSAGALVRIGRPASVAAFRELRGEDAGVRRDLLCLIIKIVEGKETARRMVEQKLHGTPPHRRRERARLQEVLDSRFFAEKKE